MTERLILDEFEERLVAGLDVLVAEAEIPTNTYEEVIGAAVVVRAGRQDVQSLRSRSGLVAAAVVTVLALTGVVAMLASRSTQTTTAGPGDTFVLPGEVVVSSDPLVVIGALGPAPRFDTTNLGEEIVFAEADPSAATRAVPLLDGQNIVKTVLIGGPDGTWSMVIVDNTDFEFAPPEKVLRLRILVSDHGGSGGLGAAVDPASLELIQLRPGDDRMPTSFWSDGAVAMDGLATDVAVVAYESGDFKAWMRPVAGIAPFPVALEYGDSFTLTAYSADGQVLHSQAATLDVEPGPDDAVPFEATVDGEDRLIEPDGRLKLFVFGAVWCSQCDGVARDIRDVIADLGIVEAVDVYTITRQREPGEVWPDDADWPYPQVVLNNAQFGVADIPAVVIVSGDNTVIDTVTGNDLAEPLAASLGKIFSSP